MAVVSLPAFAVVVPDEVDLYQPHAGFHEATSDQSGLSEDVSSVAISRRRRLSRDIECPLRSRRRDEIEGSVFVGIERLH